jgi:hypothetical protein
VITSNGELTEKYKYIKKLREAKEQLLKEENYHEKKEKKIITKNNFKSFA